LPNAHGGGIITMTTHFFSQVRQEVKATLVQHQAANTKYIVRNA